MASVRWRSELVSRYIINSAGSSYRESVREGSRLGGGRQLHRGSKVALDGLLDGLEGSAAPESLVQVEGEAAGSHCGRNGGNWTEGRQEGGSRGREQRWTRRSEVPDQIIQPIT